MPINPNVLIIGAGMTGLSAARALKNAGWRVTVVDKGRGLGGRISARRYGSTSFDHGAQYATARGPQFKAWLDDLSAAGRAAVWTPRGGDGEDPWWVGTPRMSSLVKHPDLDDVDIRLSLRVTKVTGKPGAWYAVSVHGGSEEPEQLGPYTHVLITVPAPQLSPLVQDILDIKGVQAAEIAPCWCVMVDFERPLETDFDVFRSKEHRIAWAAWEASKPNRQTGNRWTMQASADWSADHLEDDAEDIITAILSAFRHIVNFDLPGIRLTDVHRWRFARTTIPLENPYISDPSGTMLAGGDWTTGARIEAAFDAGMRMVKTLLSH